MPMIACPECEKSLKFPDDSPPRKVKCPNCQHVFMSSDAKPAGEKKGSTAGKSGAGFEVIEDDEDETPKKKSASSKRQDEDDEEDRDEDEKPKKKSSSKSRNDDDDDDDEEEEKPKKKSSKKNRDEDEEDDDDDDRPKKKSSKKNREDDDDDDERPKKKKSSKKDDDDDWADDDEVDRPKRKKKSQERDDYDDEDRSPKSKSQRGLSDADFAKLKWPALGALLNSITGFAIAGGMVLVILFLVINMVIMPGAKAKTGDYQSYVDNLKIIRIALLLAGLLGMAGWTAGFAGIGALFMGPKNKPFMIFAGGAAACALIHGVLMLLTAILPAFGRTYTGSDMIFGTPPRTTSSSSFEFWAINWTRFISAIGELPNFVARLLVEDNTKLDQVPTSTYLAMFNGFFEAGAWVLLFLAFRALFVADRDKESAKYALKGAILTGGGIVIVGIFCIVKGIILLVVQPSRSGGGDWETFRFVGQMMEILTDLIVAGVGAFAGIYLLKIRNLIRTL